jgi:hypothetical protein
MTSTESERNRKTCVDLAREKPRRIKRLLLTPRPDNQTSLEKWVSGEGGPGVLVMPRSINWEAMRRAYEFQPGSYEELVALRGIGASTVRSLALVAELVYGHQPSWRDPVRFSFAFGGKDGVPFPVDRKSMDRATELMRTGIEEARLGQSEKLRAIRRLRKCVPAIPEDRR